VPIQKRTMYPESLGCSLYNLVYVSSPGKSLSKDDPIVFDFFNLWNLVSKKPEWSRSRNVSGHEEHSCTSADKPPVSEPYFQFYQIFEYSCSLFRTMSSAYIYCMLSAKPPF
jgi:hypothetical protein